MAIAPYRMTDPLDFFDTFLGTRRGAAEGMIRSNATDVVERENDIQVFVEMPGIARDDIEIEIEDNVLTVRGEKREVREEKKDGRYHLAERRYGTFSRAFVLPRDVEADNVQAELAEGVLTVTVPKNEKARKRRIEIQGTSDRQRIGEKSEK